MSAPFAINPLRLWPVGSARPLRADARLIEALRACRDYLSTIPESAAGGDDDAVALCRRVSRVLADAGAES